MANTPLASLKFPGLPDTYTIPKNDELVNEGVKTALLQLAQKVAYIDEHGQDYYDDLYNALYPAVGVNNIIAVFNSGGVTIYDTNTLDDLRQYLTVTAIMTDSSTEVVTTYTLSGSMDAGTQTITVAYGGKTTTFTVTVVEWLTSISAVFTQSGTIYTTDSLDTLKQYLTVTATYADSTTATVSDYTLSGTLTAGTSTITVNFGGKTTTFNVTVTAWDFTWYATSGSLPTGMTNTAVTWAANNEYADIQSPNYHIGYSDIDVEIECAWKTMPEMSFAANTRLYVSRESRKAESFYLNTDGNLRVYGYVNGSGSALVINVDYTQFHRYKLHYAGGSVDVYVDGEYIGSRDDYSSQYNYEQLINTADTSKTNRLAIKSIKWRKLS